MVPALTLSKDQIGSLATLAKRSLPNESCAFLLGHIQRNDFAVTEILPMANADVSPYSFSIEPSELLHAYQHAEMKQLDVVGIFHSHPGKPSPSSTDAKYMELNPVVWLIYSTTQERFEAYIDENGIRKAELNIMD